MKLIERDFYLNKLIRIKNTPDIKVITGIRRCGKSKLMEAFIEYLKKSEPESNIIHLNFNSQENEYLTEYHALHKYINELYRKKKNNYLLIDEIQLCKDFEKAINSLHSSEKFDIYITGSNAFLLSSDLATLFTGRTFEVKIYPFSFSEYLKYYNYKDKYQALKKYINEGGMAGSYLYDDEDDKYSYIKEVFETLIIRDIKNKYKIRNISLLERLSDFLMDNISNQTSERGIADTLTSKKITVNNKTISSYLKYLCNAFAFYRIRRYDIQGKKYLSSSDKYYLCDHTFKYAKLGRKNLNLGRTLENIVAIELLRRGYEIYTGILYKKEIDFVALKRNEKIYIQVANSIEEQKTLNREIEPLLKIKDAYPKIIITRTEEETYDINGIKIYDASNWLLQEQ